MSDVIAQFVWDRGQLIAKLQRRIARKRRQWKKLIAERDELFKALERLCNSEALDMTPDDSESDDAIHNALRLVNRRHGRS